MREPPFWGRRASGSRRSTPRSTWSPRSGSRAYRANDPTSLDMTQWPPTKLAIYDAAVEVFAAQGFNAASVQAIADEAGVTKGAIYHYFESKDKLLDIITQVAMKRNVDAARARVDESISARDALALLIEQTMVGIELYRREMTLFLEQWRRAHASLPATKALRDEYEGILRGVIARGIEE